MTPMHDKRLDMHERPICAQQSKTGRQQPNLNNMSGGHFNYAQYRINDIAVEIDEVIKSNDKFGWEEGNNYFPAIIEKFKEAAHTLRQAQEMAQRVDWLLSGDDGEDSFLRRWKEEVRGYWTNAKRTCADD